MLGLAFIREIYSFHLIICPFLSYIFLIRGHNRSWWKYVTSLEFQRYANWLFLRMIPACKIDRIYIRPTKSEVLLISAVYNCLNLPALIILSSRFDLFTNHSPAHIKTWGIHLRSLTLIPMTENILFINAGIIIVIFVVIIRWSLTEDSRKRCLSCKIIKHVFLHHGWSGENELIYSIKQSWFTVHCISVCLCCDLVTFLCLCHLI